MLRDPTTGNASARTAAASLVFESVFSTHSYIIMRSVYVVCGYSKCSRTTVCIIYSLGVPMFQKPLGMGVGVTPQQPPDIEISKFSKVVVYTDPLLISEKHLCVCVSLTRVSRLRSSFNTETHRFKRFIGDDSVANRVSIIIIYLTRIYSLRGNSGMVGDARKILIKFFVIVCRKTAIDGIKNVSFRT